MELTLPSLEEKATVDLFHTIARKAVQGFFGPARLELAEDLAQETLLKAYMKLFCGGRIRECRAWLREVYRNRLIDMLRSEGSRPEHVSISNLRTLFTNPDVSPIPREIVDPHPKLDMEDRIWVSDALEMVRGALTERQQEVFALGLMGLTQREIAEIFELRPPTINAEVQAIERVIRSLWLPDDGDGGGGGRGGLRQGNWYKRYHAKPQARKSYKGGGPVARIDARILVSMLPEFGARLCELPLFCNELGNGGAALNRPLNLADVAALVGCPLAVTVDEGSEDETPEHDAADDLHLVYAPPEDQDRGGARGESATLLESPLGWGKACLTLFLIQDELPERILEILSSPLLERMAEQFKVSDDDRYSYFIDYGGTNGVGSCDFFLRRIRDVVRRSAPFVPSSTFFDLAREGTALIDNVDLFATEDRLCEHICSARRRLLVGRLREYLQTDGDKWVFNVIVRDGSNGVSNRSHLLQRVRDNAQERERLAAFTVFLDGGVLPGLLSDRVGGEGVWSPNHRRMRMLVHHVAEGGSLELANVIGFLRKEYRGRLQSTGDDNVKLGTSAAEGPEESGARAPGQFTHTYEFLWERDSWNGFEEGIASDEEGDCPSRFDRLLSEELMNSFGPLWTLLDDGGNGKIAGVHFTGDGIVLLFRSADGDADPVVVVVRNEQKHLF